MVSWDDILDRALRIEHTPMYVMSWPHVEEALQELMQAGAAAAETTCSTLVVVQVTTASRTRSLLAGRWLRCRGRKRV